MNSPNNRVKIRKGDNFVLVEKKNEEVKSK